MKSISERLKYIRKYNDLSQGKMALRLKLTPAHISNLETGKRAPSDMIISMICNEFSANESWLRTGEGEPFFDPSAALQRTYASYFMEITKAFSPVYSAYGEMMPLFQNAGIMKMYNYLAYKAKRGGMGIKNIDSLMQTFDAAFPGFELVIHDLECKSEMVRRGMEANIAAQDILKPVSGQAAAGNPLYSDFADEESVPVPPKYCNDRYMVIQAKGDSMVPHIRDGGYVVVQREARPSNGELALVFVEGWAADEYTIKLFYDRFPNVELRSYNPEYKPLVFPVSQILRAERVVHIIDA